MMVATTASLFVSTSAFSAGGPLAGDDDTSTTTEPLMKVHLTAGGVDTYRQSEIAYITFTPEASAVQHEFVDLGLPSGTLWATCNVGATTPTECGDYFAWGETEQHENMKYGIQDYSFFIMHSDGYRSEYLTKYNNHPSYGEVDNKSVLEPCDDAATVNWGNSWRMPTKEEFSELIEKCTFYSYYDLETDMRCQKVVGPNGNYILLPFAGYCSNADYIVNPYEVGTSCYYWTSTARESSFSAFCYYSSASVIIDQIREFGHPVRPVFIRPN